MDHKGMRLKLAPVDSLTLGDLDQLRIADYISKPSKLMFADIVGRFLEGKCRIWRMVGPPTSVMFVLSKEEEWLNILFAVGKGIRGRVPEIAAHLMPLAEGQGLRGLRAYVSNQARARAFGAVLGATQRPDPQSERIILELSSEDFRNGRRR